MTRETGSFPSVEKASVPSVNESEKCMVTGLPGTI
jgi:hypothetical protein